MPRRKHTAKEIINKLREVEVIIASGSTVVEAVRRIGDQRQLDLPLALTTFAG